MKRDGWGTFPKQFWASAWQERKKSTSHKGGNGHWVALGGGGGVPLVLVLLLLLFLLLLLLLLLLSSPTSPTLTAAGPSSPYSSPPPSDPTHPTPRAPCGGHSPTCAQAPLEGCSGEAAQPWTRVCLCPEGAEPRERTRLTAMRTGGGPRVKQGVARPRPRGPSRTQGVQLIWHDLLIRKVIGDAIVLPLGRPMSLRVGSQFQIQTPPVHPPPPYSPLTHGNFMPYISRGR